MRRSGYSMRLKDPLFRRRALQELQVGHSYFLLEEKARKR